MMAGIVYLVGAGPGDPGLITVKGLACLRKADVVIADYLADARLVAEAPPCAERVYLPWEPGRQEKINALMVERARAGKTVVRLKGGDPFVFGRGGEEALYLQGHGIPFEVVPGITAAVAVPAYAGIPVTHRGIASTMTAVTGHEDPAKPESALNWTAFAHGIGTLVFFMGARNLPLIVDNLLRHGRPAETPVALIQWGTTAAQRTLTGTLADIVPRALAAAFTRPVLIVVGEVVRLREQLNWFETKPLFGLRVLVTRSREQASDLSVRLAELGAEPVEAPLIRIEDPDDWSPLDEALARIDAYDWLIFTSGNAVERCFGRLFGMGKDARALARLKVAVVGSSTARRLEAFGLVADYQPERFDAEALVEGLAGQYDLRGARVLFPGADIARETVAAGLAGLGAQVARVTAYRTVTETALPPEVLAMFARKEIHLVTFASSSTVRAFAAAAGPARLPDLLAYAAVACMGPVTRRAAVEAGMTVAITPAEATIPALVDAIVAHRHRPG
jgi:uroporphyrinogen III methyltransferase/synthase